MRHVIRHFALIAVLALAIATGCQREHQAKRPDAVADGCGKMTVGWTAWSDAEAVTKLVRDLLVEHFGCEVELVMADIGLQYQGIASGDLDLMLMAWLPDTHAPYWKRFKDKVVDLGVLYTNARQGWVVPDYVHDAGLTTIADLGKDEFREKLNAKIQGIDPGAGLMQASEKTLEAYGLNYQLVSSSGAAMTAALDRAMRNNEWIVVTGWNPHWMFQRWDLRYLEDPKGTLGGAQEIHTLAREGFTESYPKRVVAFIKRILIPIEDLEAIMLEATESNYERAVKQYIANHPDRIQSWLGDEQAGGATATGAKEPAAADAP